MGGPVDLGDGRRDCCRGSPEPAEVRFSFNRREWLRAQWPGLVIWRGLAGVTLLGIVGFARSTLWALALLPVWYFFLGSMAVSMIVLLVKGRQEIVLNLRAGNVN